MITEEPCFDLPPATTSAMVDIAEFRLTFLFDDAMNIYKSTALYTGLGLILLTKLMFTSVNSAQAGVVMTNTRIIFPAQKTEKTLQFKNMDDYPNLLQVWVDSGDESTTAETAKSPFIISPQIFKMAPQQGQVLRLIFTGDPAQAPQDRESIYYLNFSEMPAIKNSDAAKNKLLVVFKSRIKIFFRPAQLVGSADDVGDELRYEHHDNPQGQYIQLYNPSPYHANISQIHLISNGQTLESQANLLIPPKSSINWTIKTKLTKQQPFNLQVNLINDYGSSVVHNLKPRTL